MARLSPTCHFSSGGSTFLKTGITSGNSPNPPSCLAEGQRHLLSVYTARVKKKHKFTRNLPEISQPHRITRDSKDTNRARKQPALQLPEYSRAFPRHSPPKSFRNKSQKTSKTYPKNFARNIPGKILKIFFSPVLLLFYFLTLGGRGEALRNKPNVSTKLGQMPLCTKEDAKMLTLTSRVTCKRHRA